MSPPSNQFPDFVGLLRSPLLSSPLAQPGLASMGVWQSMQGAGQKGTKSGSRQSCGTCLMPLTLISVSKSSLTAVNMAITSLSWSKLSWKVLDVNLTHSPSGVLLARCWTEKYSSVPSMLPI